MVSPALKRERFGLLMVAAALFAILAVSSLLLEFQVRNHSEQLRVQGVSLVRLLSSFSIEQLLSEQRRGPLAVVRQG